MIFLHASVYVVVQNFNLDVSIEGMHEMQSMKIRLMPGKVVFCCFFFKGNGCTSVSSKIYHCFFIQQ